MPFGTSLIGWFPSLINIHLRPHALGCKLSLRAEASSAPPGQPLSTASGVNQTFEPHSNGQCHAAGRGRHEFQTSASLWSPVAAVNTYMQSSSAGLDLKMFFSLF